MKKRNVNEQWKKIGSAGKSNHLTECVNLKEQNAKDNTQKVKRIKKRRKENKCNSSNSADLKQTETNRTDNNSTNNNEDAEPKVQQKKNGK